MDVESLAKQLILQNMTPEQQKAVLDSVRATLLDARGKQKQRVSENVGMVVDALKKIEADIRAKYDDLGNKITTRVNSIRDGRDGANGSDGRDGLDGRPGRDGAQGPAGPAGRDGVNGIDGVDGVSVIDAKIDFDGSLIISLSNGREINVGEVVAADVAEKIRVLTYGGSNGGGGGGTSGLTYKGTWNASTNTPTLIASSGTNGDYYIVSVAGTTDLNGITDWQPGDWVIFNGTVWQKIDQSWATAGVNNNITSMTGITGGISSPDFIQFDTGATVTNAAGRLYWDATQQTLTVGLNANIAADIGQTLYAYVTNDEAVTITKGQPVYMFAAQGDRVSVKLAYNTGDATSAKTLGVCAENIAAGQAGMVLCQGVQDGLNLSAYNPGDTLYLGATAGTLTSTKPYAPNHLVYIGVVERANAGNGRLYVRVQNGYELDELHNVSAQSPSNGQVLIYNATTSLWTKNTLTDGTGISITEGAGSITITNSAPDQTVALTAGTGISTSGTYPNFTITNSAPDQTVALTGAGTTSISGTYPNFTVTSNDQYVGTVTSVGGTGTVNGLSLSGTVTSSGNLTLGGTLTGTASINIDGTVGATTPAAGTFTDLTANNSAVVSVNTSSNALRITQTGTGNALVVEDSTNPDSTPFVVDANGRIIDGYTVALSNYYDFGGTVRTPQIQLQGASLSTAGFAQTNWASANSPPAIYLSKSRSGTIGTQGVVLSGDSLGAIQFNGDDATNFIPGAAIFGQVDGTPGTNDMPGRLVFSTTADGASTPTERVRIASTGAVGLAGANYGTSGQTIVSNGSGSAPSWGSPTPVQVQTQTISSGSGTWDKPTTGNYQFVKIEVWAGGASGGRSAAAAAGGGGGGGAYNTITIPLSYLAASENYSVGAGGAARTTTGTGNVGGNTSFSITNWPVKSSQIIAYGGGGGAGASSAGGGGGGGILSAGSSGGATLIGSGGSPTYDAQGSISNTFSSKGNGGSGGGNGGYTTAADPGGNSNFGGAGGGGAANSASVGGDSVYGGAGGGGAGSTSANAGGTSTFGGNGGAGLSNSAGTATSGSVPAGGGGGSEGGTSGAGGNGQIVLTWW